MTAVDDIGARHVRLQIAESWERSRRSGLQRTDPPRSIIREPSARDGRLARAAAPVIEDLGRKVGPVGGTLLLVDARGSLVASHFPDRAMRNLCGSLGIVPGASFTEAETGTNGLATVLASREPVTVVGDEHYIESFQQFGCYGHPVLDPVTGDLAGVLDFTCPVNAFTELVVPFIAQATVEIQRRLGAGGADRDVPPDSAARGVTTALVCGEPGSGRSTRARKLLANRPARTFDGLTYEMLGEDLWLRELEAHLLDGLPVIVDNADYLPERMIARIRRMLLVRPVHLLCLVVVGGSRDHLSPELAALAGRLECIVEVPPLRMHASDIPDIVRNYFARMAPGLPVSVDAAVMDALVRQPWPGNIAELFDVLHALVPGVTERDVTLTDLPEKYRTSRRRAGLSPLERAELEVIDDALRRYDRNKTQAAQFLGITRATLYRRMRYLGLV